MISRPKLPDHKFIKDLNFTEYIKWRCLIKNKVTQTSFLSSKHNAIKISKIIKIEDLKKEWTNLLKWLDVSYVELAYKNVTKVNDQEYKKYYDDYTSELLINNFKEDFKNFNYSSSIE